MGQHRGEYDLSGRFMKPGSSSGSLGWPLPPAKKPLLQRKPHGTASTRERKSRSRKLQLPPLKFRRRLSVKVPSEPRFPQAVGWLWKRKKLRAKGAEGAAQPTHLRHGLREEPCQHRVRAGPHESKQHRPLRHLRFTERVFCQTGGSVLLRPLPVGRPWTVVCGGLPHQ